MQVLDGKFTVVPLMSMSTIKTVTPSIKWNSRVEYNITKTNQIETLTSHTIPQSISLDYNYGNFHHNYEAANGTNDHSYDANFSGCINRI